MPDTRAAGSVELYHHDDGHTANVQVIIRRLGVSVFVDLNPPQSWWAGISVNLYARSHVPILDWPHWKRARLRAAFACTTVAVFTGGVGYE